MNTNDKSKAINSARNKDVVCQYVKLDSNDWLFTVSSSYFQDLKFSLSGVDSPQFYISEDVILADSMIQMIKSVCPKVDDHSVKMRESAVDTVLLSVLYNLTNDDSYKGLDVPSPVNLLNKIELCANRRRLEKLFVAT